MDTDNRPAEGLKRITGNVLQVVKMDATLTNLDEAAYHALRARAVVEGRSVDALMNDAIAAYLARPSISRTSSLRQLRPEPYPAGNERLSMEIDEIVYGAR